jgi:hypothetical protein
MRQGGSVTIALLNENYSEESSAWHAGLFLGYDSSARGGGSREPGRIYNRDCRLRVEARIHSNCHDRRRQAYQRRPAKGIPYAPIGAMNLAPSGVEIDRHFPTAHPCGWSAVETLSGDGARGGSRSADIQIESRRWSGVRNVDRVNSGVPISKGALRRKHSREAHE